MEQKIILNTIKRKLEYLYIQGIILFKRITKKFHVIVYKNMVYTLSNIDEIFLFVFEHVVS